jgi:catechol 2,3-dioxygenase-like lactoylglutathione lyase family enzyme
MAEKRTDMLDHIFLTVSDINRSISFYEAALEPLGISERFDFDGKNGPPGHPDLKGFGANGRLLLWLREGIADGRAAHVGFVASSRDQVDAAYTAAIAAGASDNGAPAARSYYDPRYYAANVLDPDGYSIEFVYKSWQHS